MKVTQKHAMKINTIATALIEDCHSFFLNASIETRMLAREPMINETKIEYRAIW
jgi:hypothetical protein